MKLNLVLSTVIGVSGNNGPFVQKLADKEEDIGAENVTAQKLNTEVDLARALAMRQKSVKSHLVLSMVDGVSGLLLDHVIELVLAEACRELGNVETLHLNTVEGIVLESISTKNRVTNRVVRLMESGRNGQLGEHAQRHAVDVDAPTGHVNVTIQVQAMVEIHVSVCMSNLLTYYKINCSAYILERKK